MPERFISVAEICKESNVVRATVIRWLASGVLIGWQGKKPNGTWHVERSSYEAMKNRDQGKGSSHDSGAIKEG